MMDDAIWKKLKRFETPGQARFLTFSCHDQLTLLGTPSLRNLFVTHLAMAREKCRFGLSAWVVMPDHVHLMIVPKVEIATVSEICRAIKQPVASKAIARWRKLKAPILPRLLASDGRTRFWRPGGGFDRNVRKQEEFLDEVNYIHANPVKRKLVANPLDWEWSSARWYAGLAESPPIDASKSLQHYVRTGFGLPVDHLLEQGDIEEYQGE